MYKITQQKHEVVHTLSAGWCTLDFTTHNVFVIIHVLCAQLPPEQPSEVHLGVLHSVQVSVLYGKGHNAANKVKSSLQLFSQCNVPWGTVQALQVQKLA